ncbi:2OG-Fe(II) oxygenase [Streptomyces bauhiniae]|uniref:2OG-Fe(II) oxygenase n=1 Tax=Streptomyces bauhiniae TaxID=2340725 RepID=UPI00339F4ABA
MIPTLKTDTFAVFDDFLSPEDLTAVRRYVADERMTYLKNMRKPNHLYRLVEGDPLLGPTTFYGHPNLPQGFSSYPSGTPVDTVCTTLLDGAEAFSSWIGFQGTDWQYFSCTPYVYPAGSGLSWHDDALGRAGSFVLYVHDEWKSSWGAELLIANQVGQREPRVEQHQGVDTDLGHYVAPVPNRLVVIRAGTPHRVKNVSARAGDHYRMSVTGFFESRPTRSADTE